MEELTERLKKVEIAPCDSLPIAHPFHPPAKYGINSEVPRYLFRVYSPSSAGDNSVEGFTSEDGSGPKGNLTDIFARSPEAVAISLNEHLRWSRPRSRRDPFISWTSSMAFALHYAIYKSKEEGVGLGEIMLCVIDTTKFPPGTFMQDLSLVKMFESRVRASELITVYGTLETWGAKGLGDFLDLRTARKRRGVYYFGEYLSQGRTYVAQGRSSTVSIDKIIDADIFQIAPQLQREAMSTTKGRFQRSRWADAVLDLRQDFHKGHDPASQLNSKQREAGRHIAFQFSSQFTVPVLANLLSLRPLWTNITIGTAILQCDPDRVRAFCLQPTRVVADDTIPEVLQFQRNVRSIHEACYNDALKRACWLSGYIGSHLGTGINDPEVHASMFGGSLEDWAAKVGQDTEELKRTLEEVRLFNEGEVD